MCMIRKLPYELYTRLVQVKVPSGTTDATIELEEDSVVREYDCYGIAVLSGFARTASGNTAYTDLDTLFLELGRDNKILLDRHPAGAIAEGNQSFTADRAPLPGPLFFDPIRFSLTSSKLYVRRATATAGDLYVSILFYLKP
jgi:hypothetical protein